MFDGRHCTQKDLDLLEIETNNVLNNVNDDNLNSYLRLIDRFDQEIADKIRWQIKGASGDINKIKEIIRRNIDTLKQNVIVDIYEHQ